MASTAVSLGSAELVSSTSGTALKLHSRACFASSEEDAHLAFGRLTTAALTATTASAGTRLWIAKGNDYRLVVRLTFDDAIGCASQDECTRAAAATLQDTQLWRGCLLQVTAVRQSYEHDGSNVIELGFAYLAKDGDTTPSRVHKLADGVPVSDVSAPPDIKTVDCKSVCLDMRIIPAVRDGHRNPYQNTGGRQSMLSSGDDTGPGFNTADQADEELLDSSSTSNVASEDERRPQHEASVSRRSKTAPTRSASGINDRQSGGMRRSYSADDCGQQAAWPLQTSDFLDLFDAAFRLAVSCRAKRGSRHVKIASVESLRHLSHIMPSLWSSGYLAEVSSRAVLLPTISHALSNVSAVHPRSTQLRSKLDELMRRSHANTPSQDYQQQSKQLNIAESCLSTYVWSLVQHSLCDRAAIVRFSRIPSRQNTGRTTDSDLTCDIEFDGCDWDTHDSILEHEKLEPNHGTEPKHDHDTTITDLDEAMVPWSARAACIERGNGMGEEEMLSLCGSVGSRMSLDLDLDLAAVLPKSDTIVGQGHVGAYQSLDTRPQRDDLGEILPI